MAGETEYYRRIANQSPGNNDGRSPNSTTDESEGVDDLLNRSPGEGFSEVTIEYGSGGRKIAINSDDAESIAKGVGETVLAGTFEENDLNAFDPR